MRAVTDFPRSSDGRAHWWNRSVYYQLNVRGFVDSDGDGVGDINGLRSHLGYLELLGVDVVWMTYVFDRTATGEGTELDPLAGDLPSLDRLVEEAHAAGLRLVLDLAFSRSVLDVPDPASVIADGVSFWLDRGMDGLRLGAAPRSDEALDDDLHRMLDLAFPVFEDYPDAMLAALLDERWYRDPQARSPMHLGVDMRFGLADFDAVQVRRVIDSVLGRPGRSLCPTWSLGRADRLLPTTRFGGGTLGRQRARAAALVLMALPGSIGFDHGEELGLPNAETLRNSAVRPPMPWEGSEPPFGFSDAPGPWDPWDPDWAKFTVESQLEDDSSTLSLYRNGIDFRHRLWDPLDHEIEWYGAPEGCLAFRRSAGGAICALNTSGEAVQRPSGEVLLASTDLPEGELPANAAVWLTGRTG